MAPQITDQKWYSIAEQASKETDPAKLTILVDQLCGALDEGGRPPALSLQTLVASRSSVWVDSPVLRDLPSLQAWRTTARPVSFQSYIPCESLAMLPRNIEVSMFQLGFELVGFQLLFLSPIQATISFRIPLSERPSHHPALRFQGVAPLTRGCSAQAWEANGSSRKFGLATAIARSLSSAVRYLAAWK